VEMENSISGVAPGNIVSLKFLRGGRPRKSEIIV